jgi:hypothetical protein
MQRPKVKQVAAVVAAGITLFVGSAAITRAAGGSGSTLVPVVPVRVLDTREPGADFDVLSAGEVGRLNLAGDVPATAVAVDLNITVTGGTAASFLTVWPTGDSLPNSSVLNWDGPGRTDANSVAVKLGLGQQLDVITGAGDVQVIVDLMGYYIEESAGTVGPQGPQGPKGDPGQNGTNGRDGILGQTVVTGAVTAFASGVETTATAMCPAGKVVLSGGFEASQDIGHFDGHPFILGPTAAGNGWQLRATSTPAQSVTVKALCATISS